MLIKKEKRERAKRSMFLRETREARPQGVFNVSSLHPFNMKIRTRLFEEDYPRKNHLKPEDWR